MRCGCPQCGTYMVQREHGLQSGCVCPACLHQCGDCMGTEQPPAQSDALCMEAQLRERIRAMEEELEQ